MELQDILIAVLTLAVGIIGYLSKLGYNDFVKQFEKQDKRMDTLALDNKTTSLEVNKVKINYIERFTTLERLIIKSMGENQTVILNKLDELKEYNNKTFMTKEGCKFREHRN